VTICVHTLVSEPFILRKTLAQNVYFSQLINEKHLLHGDEKARNFVSFIFHNRGLKSYEFYRWWDGRIKLQNSEWGGGWMDGPIKFK